MIDCKELMALSDIVRVIAVPYNLWKHDVTRVIKLNIASASF